jgi:hypothetical protein
LEYAVKESRLLGLKYVDTEHLLIGLLTEREGIACRVLNPLGIRLAEAKKTISDLLYTAATEIEQQEPATEINEPPPPGEQTTPGLQLRHILCGDTGIISEIVWSPDGMVLASGSSDNTIRLWDGQSGELRRRLKGHESAVRTVAWSPDGQMLASGSDDGTIRLWDTTTWSLKASLESGASVTSIAWSPDGQMLASGSGRSLLLWDTGTGEQRRTLEGPDNTLIG